jgi:hypothetical protein
MKPHLPLIAALCGLLAQAQAHAHEGHGIAGASHWHATDTWGLMLGAAAVVALVWLTRGGK